MCAGAILQARIDTLVWGAPNKLLGADGSWIRYEAKVLFLLLMLRRRLYGIIMFH